MTTWPRSTALEGRGEAVRTARTLFTTPEPAAVGPIEACAFDGLIPAPDLRLGLLYQRPDTCYPLHSHDADETYVVLAGRALWTAGDDVRMRVAGDMIHHPSLMPHAFRAGPQGFVALYRWSGDMNTHSHTFLDDPEARAV